MKIRIILSLLVTLILIVFFVKSEEALVFSLEEPEIQFSENALFYYPLFKNVKDVSGHFGSLVYYEKSHFSKGGFELTGTTVDSIVFAYEEALKLNPKDDFTFSMWIQPKKSEEPIGHRLQNLVYWAADSKPTLPRVSIWFDEESRGLHINCQSLRFNLPLEQETLFSQPIQITLIVSKPNRLLELYIDGTLKRRFVFNFDDYPDAAIFQIAQGRAPLTGKTAVYSNIEMWDRRLRDTEIQQVFDARKAFFAKLNTQRTLFRWIFLLSIFGVLLLVWKKEKTRPF